MLYYLFQYLESSFDFPGARLFSYISFRSGVAFILALFIATIIGRRIINKLQILQIGELVRDLRVGRTNVQERHAYDGWDYHYYRYIDTLFVGRETGKYLHDIDVDYDRLAGSHRFFGRLYQGVQER